MKIFNLVVVYLMVHNHMSHNQAKKWVLSWIYRAATDFEKSKKKMIPPGPGGFGIIKKNFFHGNRYFTSWTYQINIWLIFWIFSNIYFGYFLCNLFISRIVACKNKKLIVTPLAVTKSNFTVGFSVVDLVENKVWFVDFL